jgi:hypothetical protein
MKIQGFQPTQNAASYTPSSKVSTPATSAAAAPGTSDVYSGERATRATEIMAGQDLSNMAKCAHPPKFGHFVKTSQGEVLWTTEFALDINHLACQRHLSFAVPA